VPGDYTEESGVYAARGLLNCDLPTAVFAGNDRCVHGILATFRRAGLRIPDDVSVVGYGDSPTRVSFIDLTTAGQDVPRMADLAAQAAAQRLAGPRTAGQHAVVIPTLTVRSSTGS
jgi:DNA-binding LacI/PurR family transcriptional regulator